MSAAEGPSIESPYCTSTALIAVIGRIRCDKHAGHDDWHRWQIEWDDTRGPVEADLRLPIGIWDIDQYEGAT